MKIIDRLFQDKKRNNRPRAYDPPVIWEVSQLLEHQTKKDHPALESAIFIVHGMGKQDWVETAAVLRKGFEDVTEIIKDWQQTQRIKKRMPDPLIAPFIYDGFWANYANLKETFPEEWKKLKQKGEKKFFELIWETRPVSSSRTAFWFLKKQFSLLFIKPNDIKNLRSLTGYCSNIIVYILLQIVGTFSFLMVLIIRPKIMKEYLADVRLYCDPKGEIEQAIVQRIDKRVGGAFLKMIGIDWDFKNLNEDDKLCVSGELFEFRRIVWVAHSLGTVISYNVLSDLFARAQEIEISTNSTEVQIMNVKKFRNALHRFVTFGSPLDKIAYIFKEKTLRPWPKNEQGNIVRSRLLESKGEFDKGKNEKELCAGEKIKGEWWINFYHILDPVSGSLSADFICGDNPPYNYHLKAGWIPVWAHIAYWKDKRMLRFILGRTYGSDDIEDKYFKPWHLSIKIIFALLAYLSWLALLIGICCVLKYLIYEAIY